MGIRCNTRTSTVVYCKTSLQGVGMRGNKGYQSFTLATGYLKSPIHGLSHNDFSVRMGLCMYFRDIPGGADDKSSLAAGRLVSCSQLFLGAPRTNYQVGQSYAPRDKALTSFTTFKLAPEMPATNHQTARFSGNEYFFIICTGRYVCSLSSDDSDASTRLKHVGIWACRLCASSKAGSLPIKLNTNSCLCAYLRRTLFSVVL